MIRISESGIDGGPATHNYQSDTVHEHLQLFLCLDLLLHLDSWWHVPNCVST